MEKLERLLNKPLTEAFREEKPEDFARRIILAHKEGSLTLEDIENIALLLRKRKEEDPLAHATKELLVKYLIYYIHSQRFSPKEAKLAHLVKEALERGEDPIEFALKEVPIEDVVKSFAGVRKRRHHGLNAQKALTKILHRFLEDLSYLKEKTNVRASDLIHLYHFLVSHGLPNINVKVARMGPNKKVYIETVPMKPSEYLGRFLHNRINKHKLFDPLNLLLSIRDAYKETGERIEDVHTVSGSPDFVRIREKLIPLSTEFYNIIVEELGIPLDYILRANPNYAFLLARDPESVKKKVQALESLGLPLSYILRAHPTTAIFFLNSSIETVKQRIRTLERREGRSIKELVKKYAPDTLLKKILTTHPP